MVNPIKAVGKLFGGGEEAPDINIPAPPAPLRAAKSPTAQPGRKRSMQQSFLSGAAAAQTDASGGARGKTLLGA